MTEVWLPFEDRIAGASEVLVYHEEYPLKVHFTRESWNTHELIKKDCAC